MTNVEHSRLVGAIRDWAFDAGDPDRPVLEIGYYYYFANPSNGTISARQLLNEVEEQTELGRWFEAVVEAGAERTSFDEVLSGFGVLA